MIKAPNWQKDAIPTTNGWMHPKRKELLVSRPISQTQIDEYLGLNQITATITKKKLVSVDSVTVDNIVFTDKDKLEEYVFEEYKIDLNRRKSLKNMAKELETLRGELYNERSI